MEAPVVDLKRLEAPAVDLRIIFAPVVDRRREPAHDIQEYTISRFGKEFDGLRNFKTEHAKLRSRDEQLISVYACLIFEV